MTGPMRLTLMVGPAAPIPAPREVVDALTGVTITSGSEGPSVCQLEFTVSNRSPLHTLFLLAGGATPAMIRVVVMVTVRGMPEVLFDGVMTNHEVRPGGSAGSAALTVTCEDLRRVMDYIELSGIPYPAMPPELRVLTILAKYAVFGIIPVVIPPIMMDVPIPVERIPAQQGTDLEYIELLANEVGHVFYIEPGPAPGTSIAYWGPEVKVGMPQPALNVDWDAHTNVDSVSFDFNPEAPTLPLLWIQEPFSKATIPIPVPEVDLLNPPLGLIPPIPKRVESVRGTAKLDPIRAGLRAVSQASRSADAVTGRGSLDVLRYGNVLRPRRLVGVRGVGTAFEGLYYIKSVTHKLDRETFKQDFQLTRNGLVSTVPMVPP